MSIQIKYVRELGNFIVEHGRQRLVAQSRFFCRLTNASPNAIVGITDVTVETAAELGFVNLRTSAITEEAVAV